MEDLLVPKCEYSIVTEKYVEKSLGKKDYMNIGNAYA